MGLVQWGVKMNLFEDWDCKYMWYAVFKFSLKKKKKLCANMLGKDQVSHLFLGSRNVWLLSRSAVLFIYSYYQYL